jgi:hypothetical protein
MDVNTSQNDISLRVIFFVHERTLLLQGDSAVTKEGTF